MASIMLAEKSTGIMSATAFKSPIIDRSIPFPACNERKPDFEMAVAQFVTPLALISNMNIFLAHQKNA